MKVKTAAPVQAGLDGRIGLPASRLGYGLLALAALILAAALLWPEGPPAGSAGATGPGAEAGAVAGSGLPGDSAPESSGRTPSTRDDWQQHPWAQAGMSGPATSDDLADHVPRGSAPRMEEVIARLHQAGIRTGLGAFNPPGTNPPLVGLAVPEGYELPPGYVRHHQATDDGQRIEAILMFAPDHPFRDAAGRPIAIPANRVVPAELAPPGFPIRYIEIPRAVEAGGSAQP